MITQEKCEIFVYFKDYSIFVKEEAFTVNHLC